VLRSLLVLAALAAPVSADPPCTRCTIDLPTKHDGPVPLVVVLHGDRQKATAIEGWWRDAVVERGWALLSLQCPTDLGCTDSWWKWNGRADWVTDQIAKLDGIDHHHMYLIGWSGGATYIGEHAQAWSAFAAIVIHGGGVAPDDESCPAGKLPAYFLVGDQNPLHAHVKLLRDYWEACKQDLTWDLVAGADHEHEERALTAKKARIILDWMAQRSLAPAS
jgi:predicted esterase